MRFSKKLALLIGGCGMVLGGLCLIQYRLIRNTYRLEEAARLQQVKQRLEDKSQSLSDSLNHQVMAALLQHVQGQLKKAQKPLLNNFQQQIDSIGEKYRYDIQHVLLSDSLLRDIMYGLQYTRVVLYSGQVADTLLGTGSKPLVLAGDDYYHSPAVFSIGEGLQQAGFSLSTGMGSPTVEQSGYRLAVWTKPMVFASQWQKAVFHRMALTLAGSVLLILAMTVIFFLVFMALLRQKKVADITTDFANNMTHELKTPLSTAAVVVKSLRVPEAKLDEEWYHELLNQLDGQHEKIRRMMDSVLTSAIDQPMGMVQLHVIRLSSLLQEMKILAAASGRDLLITENDNLAIHTDPDLLTGILANLVDNALKYTPAGTPLAIHSEATGRTLRISLEDRGPGIHASHQRYLFKKFFRVPAQGNHVRGLGLGLYLCCMQAKQLGGSIVYQRNAYGGSTFTITLPYDKDAVAIGGG